MLDIDTLATTVDVADTYHERQGHADWTGSDPIKTSALWRAQSFIAGKYNSRWLVSFEPDDAPMAVQYSIAEAARLELITPGVLSPTLERGGAVKRLRERVEGAVETEVEYMDAAPAEQRITAIENILTGAGLIRTGNTLVGFVSRA